MAAGTVQAPVFFELKESPNGGLGGLIVRAKNKNTFSSSANLLLSWRVLLDGVPLLVGDPAQRGLGGWYPGGSVAIAPQVHSTTLPNLRVHCSWALMQLLMYHMLLVEVARLQNRLLELMPDAVRRSGQSCGCR